MQTLEQIVGSVINKSSILGRAAAYAVVNNDEERYNDALDKLAKLREDTILQINECIADKEI